MNERSTDSFELFLISNFLAVCVGPFLDHENQPALSLVFNVSDPAFVIYRSHCNLDAHQHFRHRKEMGNKTEWNLNPRILTCLHGFDKGER